MSRVVSQNPEWLLNTMVQTRAKSARIQLLIMSQHLKPLPV